MNMIVVFYYAINNKDYFLCFKKKDEKIIFENSLTSLEPAIPGKNYRSFLIGNSFQDAALII